MKLYVLCVVLGSFSASVLSSGYQSCKTPTLRYGRLRSRQRGRVLKFICNAGYQLVGERSAFCINGTWDVDIPMCVRSGCQKAESPPLNGLVLPTHSGAVLNYYCKQGYELNGPGVVSCDGFQWSSSRPSCIPSQTKPSLFCDFENVNICHWTHDLNHDMDWVRDSYKTPTGYSMPTGPSHDHTKGAGSNGFYMYLESSSRRINDTARLISPIFEKIDGNICLEFWYHMYGRTIGTLKAYVKRTKDPWPLQPEKAVFTKSGEQGDLWQQALVDLGAITEPFQLIMEGVRGNGYVSDMAIDDIKLIPNCVYNDYIQTTTELVTEETVTSKTLESCQDRCGLRAFGNESSQIIACDCDEFCYETSRCCPDYIDLCLNFSTTEESTTTEYYTTEDVHNTLPPVTKPKTSNKNISLPILVPTYPSTLKPIPQPPSTIPTLIILKAPTTPQIIQILKPKFPSNKNASKITFVKPQITTSKAYYHDDVEMPSKIKDEVTASGNIDEDSNDINDISLPEKEGYVEKITNEKNYTFKIANPEHIGEIKTEFIQVQDDKSAGNLMFIIVGSLIAIVLFVVLMATVMFKLQYVRCRNRRMASGQGDSQSDVRFLTADEVLDFNLDKDYDDL